MTVFRSRKGLSILVRVLEHGLSWKEGVEDEDRLVMDVQRMEGVRLAFEALGWALHDRENIKAFEVGTPNTIRATLTSRAMVVI